MKYRYAITRSPGINFLDAISSKDESKTIDLEKALHQHQAYCTVLEKLGLIVIRLPPDSSFPDGCFVEDPITIFKNLAIVTNQAASTRKGEGKVLKDVIKHFKLIKTMKKPATMDGGDVMVTPKTIFIGLSKRTNTHGINQYKNFIEKNKM